MNNYHNTTKLKGQELSRSKTNADKQDRCLREFFSKRKGKYTAWQMGNTYLLYNHLSEFISSPITSIRRSINTLYNEGFIERCERTDKFSPYGAKEYSYKRAKK